MAHMTVAVTTDGKVQWYDDGELYFWMGHAARTVDGLKRNVGRYCAELFARDRVSICDNSALAACLRTAWGD